MNDANANPKEHPAETAAESTAGLGQLLLIYGATVLLAVAAAALIWDTSTALVGLLSGLVCGVAAIAAFLLGIFPRGEFFRLTRLYTASAVRIAIPVLYLFIARTAFPDLFDQGMVYFVVLFYLVGLLTDLVLQLRRNKLLHERDGGVLGHPVNGE